MPKKWYTVQAREGSDVAEISILDYIGMFGVNAPEFLAEFKALRASTVKVFINSPGGSVFDALAIFNGMRASGKTIEVHVLGVAASAASYIAMAGDTIVMPANTMMFVHNPLSAVHGNADELRAAADVLDKIGESLMATYRKRFKGEEAVLQQLFADESYLTASECLQYGLCDEVTDEIVATAAFDVEALPEAVRTVFERARPAVSALQAAEIEAIAEELGVREYAGVLALDAAIQTPDQARAAAREAAEVVALCRVLGRVEATAGLVRSRKSYADVRAQLAQEMAALDAKTAINTARSSASLNPQGPATLNPLTLWDEIHQLEKQSRSSK